MGNLVPVLINLSHESDKTVVRKCSGISHRKLHFIWEAFTDSQCLQVCSNRIFSDHKIK